MNRRDRRTLLVAIALFLGPLGIVPGQISNAAPSRGEPAAAYDGPQSIEPGTVLSPRTSPRRQPQRACRSGSIALTFDDGPSPVTTARLVRILVREQVPATFFMNGARVRSAPTTVRYVDRSGFTIANHTWSHAELTGLSGRQIRGQLLKTGAELRRLGVETGTLMRPPYGAINPRVTREIRGLGLVPVLWTADSMDWSGGSAREIAHRILVQLRPNQENIVLQHDGVANSPASVAAVPIVIRAARARGYCFSDLGPRGGVAPVKSAYARAVDRALARKAGETRAAPPKQDRRSETDRSQAPGASSAPRRDQRAPEPSRSTLLGFIAQAGSIRQWATPPSEAAPETRSLTSD